MIRLDTCRVNFGARLIDMHAHVGKHEHIYYTKDMLDVFVKQPLPNNDTVEKMIVSDTDTFKGLKDEYNGNKTALQSLQGDNTYSLLASCSPKNGNISNIERLLTDFPNSFVGLKFHPNDLHLPVSDSRYQPYFEFANRNKIPCLFHTQVPVDSEGKLFRLPDGTLDKSKLDPFGDPGAIYEAAKKYKDAPFIMAHMGGGWNESHERAIDVLVESVKKGDANLYADISWVDIDAKPVAGLLSPKDHIVKAIKKLKGIGDPDWKFGDQSFRLMFGTDAPIARFCDKNNARLSYAKFVEEIKAAIRGDKDLAKESEKIIEDLFYNNAKKLFFPEKIAETAANAAKKSKKSGGRGKIIAGVATAIAAIGGGAAAVRSRKTSTKK